MVTEIPRAILDNKALPDWGEPENPLRPEDLDTASGMRDAGPPAGPRSGSGAGSSPTTILRVK